MFSGICLFRFAPKTYISQGNAPFTQMTQQITTTTNEQIDFEYGGDNQRVLKIFDAQGNTTKTLYLHGMNDYPLMEKTTAGTAPESRVVYIYGLTGLLAMQKDGVVYYLLKDHLGSTRVLVDETGTVAAYYDYAPFGNLMRFDEDVEVSYKFTAQEFDFESGLHNFRARLYDSDLGRFYAVDAAGQFASPFLYAGNNPVVYVDEDGRIAWFVPILIGAAINVAFNYSNIHTVGDFFSFAAVGAFQGAAALVAPAGIIPGAIFWGAVGAVTSGANATLAGVQNIGSAILIGGITGAILGGITGGLQAKAQGLDIWTGQPKLSTNRLEIPKLETLDYEEFSKTRRLSVEIKEPVLEQHATDLADEPLHFNRAYMTSDNIRIPEKLYYYTSKETSILIEESGQLGLPGRTTYLTIKGDLTPVQAQLDLALPSHNTAEVLIEVSSKGIDASKIVIMRRVTGNVFNRPGGGWEILYEGVIKNKYP